MSASLAFQRKIPVDQPYDLVVCGGGPSGIPAALGARRAGLKVLLVEQTGQLGGNGTSAGVSHLLGCRTSDNRAACVAGVFQEIVDDLVARGGAIDPRTIKGEEFSPHGWSGAVSACTYGVPFDPIQMALLLDEKMLASGVDVLFFTSVVDAVVENERIEQIVLFNKSGLFAVPTQAVVDATGDADVAARSGCEFVKGRSEDGLMTPATLMLHVDRVDQNALASDIYKNRSPRFRELIRDLRAKGLWDFPYEIFISVQLQEKGTMMINTTRICDVDGTDGRSISRGMMQGRKEVHKLFELMRAHFPGFANARIKLVAPVLGIRETRRIVGDFVLTVQDLFDERDFEDTIGFSGYSWDLPDPKKPSYQPMQDGHAPAQRRRDYTPIPYRVMVPKPVANVICPGRAISVERDVLGPLREQGPCYAMGHAAGLAATQVLRKGIPFAEVDVPQLREDLRRAGAMVDWAEQPVAASCI
ncbi:MAG TPA: FAD-dependent oxidoreductase [Tepidisphaeraceae bacterium]|nr:FAD-dependent oxidoreductase [Tepidisphaeraceae bacterium]